MKKKTLREILEEKGINLSEKKVEALENLGQMKAKVLADDWANPEIAPDAIINLCKTEEKFINSMEKSLQEEKPKAKSNIFSSFKFT
jgi:hypothetical protein